MRTTRIALIVLAASVTLAAPAFAADASAEPSQQAAPAYDKTVAQLGACAAAALIVVGGGMGIARIAGRAVDGIARQPEAAGQMFTAWMIPAAMIEGAVLFGVVLCLLVVGRT